MFVPIIVFQLLSCWAFVGIAYSMFYTWQANHEYDVEDILLFIISAILGPTMLLLALYYRGKSEDDSTGDLK